MVKSASSSAAVGFDFADPAFRRDPYPTYGELREQRPVLRTEHGYWVVSRYSDCLAVLKDHHRFSSDARNAISVGVFPEHSAIAGRDVEIRPYLFFDFPRYIDGQPFDEGRPFLFLDPPDHTRLRRLVTQAFTRSALEAWRPRVREVAQQLLDAAAERGDVELVADLAYPLPVTIICELLGVPVADTPLFRQWSGALAATITPEFLLTASERERSREAGVVLGGYLGQLMTERRSRPGDDLLSGLLLAEAEGDQLSEVEVLFTCLLLLVAGHETTVNLLGSGTLALARHPEQGRLLRAQPGMARAAVEELLRFEPPVQVAARTPLAEMEISGEMVPAGEQLVLLLGAANRDPSVFADPDRLDLRRPNAARHLSFGSGIHHCLGAALARLEAEEAIPAVLARFPHLELRGEPRYRSDSILRGLEELPLAG